MLSANLAVVRSMPLNETLKDPRVREWWIRWGFRVGFTLLGVLSIYELVRG